MTPTPEQIAKVARFVRRVVCVRCGGSDDAHERRIGVAESCRDPVFVPFIHWQPITNPADRMDLQDRVRAMGYAMTYCASANDAQQCVIQGEGLGATGWRKVHGYGPDDAHALFWAVWKLVETPR